ncbi:mycofactocin system FadH/OYE family oxidoreductase 1 [Pseudonocardia oroxyli]|uniref:Mycofactocin system FadH/OYE family oxidoreductase 1 n=1 Tax=Pseudonocardia oroxyli TaxID=366584 RepID=A0A1G7FS57_PSEOR|nr:mycofactocin system FadH/OYE family oxidoreductase 1 [Pseudonocardia oroxyli]SDE78718.1 mycofactocin system FadH/OYE family oxidoreductase 1 [Pseudonocardia oroxyli]
MLGEAVRVGSRIAPSRVLFGPHVTNLGRGRSFSERHRAYYAARAEGGCGVIVCETASVHPSDRPYERAPEPGWAAVAGSCGPALLLASLGHSGSQGTSAFTGRALWGASRIPDVVSREVPQVVEQPEIDALVAGFAAAAARAVADGLDGVELNAGQHSLLRQFLSGLTNTRTDAYGEDRTLLLRQVLAAVRAAVGDAVVGLRLCVDELAPWAGLTPEQLLPLTPKLRDLVDYLVPVRGSGLSVSATRPDLHTPPGFNRALAGTFLGRGLDVVLQGSVVDPGMAEAAVAEGFALVEMTRAQIADPRLVAHVRAGTPERIRPCTLANQHRARDPRNPLITDEAEPRSGHETLDPPLPHAPRPRTGPPLLVVGGGPAGLEAARTAALLGRPVRLLERADRLGGMLRVAAALPARGRFGLLVHWWARELERLGVEVQLGVEAGPADLVGDVLLATGSVPSAPAFEVGAGVRVSSAAEAAGAYGPGDRVVVHDPIGDWTGVAVAEQVAAAGVPCALVTPDAVAGTQLSRTGDLADANARLERAGVERVLFARVRAVGGGRAVVEDVHHGAIRELPATLVIDCAHRLPDLRLAGHPRIGDCLAPRTVHEAVRDARRAVGC